MTILPGDGSSCNGNTTLPNKRAKLSLKSYTSAKRNEPNTNTSSMDSLSGMTPFYAGPHRYSPFSKYDPEPSRSSGTDDSPASENTSSSERSPPVMATLSNMGNTCFLNSVLYTLRFAPHFLHQLHHVMVELSKLRPASANVLSRSERTQLAVERLHELFQALRGTEDSKSESPFDPIQPTVFFSAFREVNAVFETNQQHDAHELLVALLDNVRETCLLLKQLREKKQQSPSPAVKVDSEGKSLRKGKNLSAWSKNTKKQKGKIKEEPQQPEDSVPSVPAVFPCPNFIAKDFEGVMAMRTTCLECETATERKETFCDICVPIKYPLTEEELEANCREGVDETSRVFHSALLSSEHIDGANKYWCEECLHYNEARRNIQYQTLPRILTLQLKRFSSTFGSIFSVSKVNDFMPTPLTLSCFCESCCRSPEPLESHSYQLFAAIMHVGATMASGHYISFVKATDNVPDYCSCDIHQASLNPTPQPSSSNGKILKFFKSKTEKSNVSSLGANVCPGTDCCGIRLAIEQGSDAAVPEPNWLECDDDAISVISKTEFEERLSQSNLKSSSLTPYLLFYAQSP